MYIFSITSPCCKNRLIGCNYVDKVLTESLKVESCAGCAFVFICALSSLLVAQGGTGGDILISRVIMRKEVPS